MAGDNEFVSQSEQEKLLDQELEGDSD